MKLKREQIKSFEWEEKDVGADDGEPLYEGTITVHCTDGTTLKAYLDWVRQGDMEDFCDGNINALMEYQQVYGIDDWALVK